MLGAARPWPRGQESCLPPRAKPGRRVAAFATAAVTQEPTQKRRHRSREGELLSLDFESLMSVRRYSLSGRSTLRFVRRRFSFAPTLTGTTPYEGLIPSAVKSRDGCESNHPA